MFTWFYSTIAKSKDIDLSKIEFSSIVILDQKSYLVYVSRYYTQFIIH